MQPPKSSPLSIHNSPETLTFIQNLYKLSEEPKDSRHPDLIQSFQEYTERLLNEMYEPKTQLTLYKGNSAYSSTTSYQYCLKEK